MISLALAGGGERAVAWETGVLAGLADAGLDLRRADTIVGTSAGALVAARLAAGRDPRDRPPAAGAKMKGPDPFRLLAAAWDAGGDTLRDKRQALGRMAIAMSPGGEERFVERIASLLPSERWPEPLRIVAIDAEAGERVVFDAASGVPLARAVAASRAVPGLLPPVTIGGRRYIDGALGSATNADVLGGLAVIVAPLPAVATNAAEALMLAALRAEVAALDRPVVIDALPEDLAAMGPDPMSAATAPLASAAGRARGRAQISPARAA
jgi:NTE family protein